MKIRIKANSVRYRLTRPEVATLGATGSLEAHTEFAHKTLVYAIVTTTDNMLSADFVGNRIVLNMPKAMIDELAGTDTVGFSGETGNLKLLVEKDFACIDHTDEDQSDNYPNPQLSCQ